MHSGNREKPLALQIRTSSVWPLCLGLRRGEVGGRRSLRSGPTESYEKVTGEDGVAVARRYFDFLRSSGLLGLAFDPDYAHNGFFYVDLIKVNGDTEVCRYPVSDNPNVAPRQFSRSIDLTAHLARLESQFLEQHGVVS